MGDPIQPSAPLASDDSYQLGLFFTAGGGYALRNDGEHTASGPQFEFALGGWAKLGENRFYAGGAGDFIALQSPLFGQSDSHWVRTITGRLGFGREINPWLTLKTQVELGIATYGSMGEERIVNGVFTRERSAAFHLALGAGACFWKERLCPMVQYSHDFGAYSMRRTDLNQDLPNLESRTVDTNGFQVSLLADIARF